MPTAILVDGSFFLKRYPIIYGRHHSAEDIVKNLYTMVLSHVGPKKENDKVKELYRIFYYDCYPYDQRAHNPITNKCIDFSKTDEFKLRSKIIELLKRKRKVALRLGYLKASKNWIIRPIKSKELLSKKIKIEDLTENDVYYDLKQKGIDIKIGSDIASMAYKKLVKQIILISGDSDFVPCAKLARREGIDFILDPMWNPIPNNLFEHIDGLHSTCKNPSKK